MKCITMCHAYPSRICHVLLSFKAAAMAATVNLELDPIFLKALGFLHSKSKDSAEKLKALLDESLARGTDSSYRPSQKVQNECNVGGILCHNNS